MASNKLKVSLLVIGILALGLAGASFFVGMESPVKHLVVNDNLQTAQLIIDFNDGARKSFELEPNGENLFVLTKNKLSEEGMELDYESYSGLGELITQIGDKRGGVNDKYWQYWVNGNYAQVGASSQIVKPGDIIEWKFTDERQ